MALLGQVEATHARLHGFNHEIAKLTEPVIWGDAGSDAIK
jgi:hypothetical protein